jgi:beta-N-acetylhexosaminidase
MNILLVAVILVSGLFAFAQDEGSALRRTLEDPALRQPKADVEDRSETETAPEPGTATVDYSGLRRAVSQLMLVTLEGTTTFTTSDRQLVQKYPPGGVIIKTISRPTFALEYVKRLRGLPIETRLGMPLLIGTDLFTLPRRDKVQMDSFVQTPSLLAIAAADDEESTRSFAEFMATQLEVMGFNMHMGPSLALAPTLPGSRGTVACLGSNPEFAARASERIVSTLDEKGIVTLPMNFPGGQNNRRPDEPPVLLTASNVLKKADLLPYIKAIEAGAKIMHVGTTIAPTLDPSGTPACLSQPIMTGLLRQDLTFEGVVVAGPLDTADIARYSDLSEAAIMALESGADMILWNSAGTRVMKTVDDIVLAIVEGRLDETLIEQKLLRINALKEYYGLKGRELPKEKLARSLEKKRIYPIQSYEIERRSVTLLLNRDNVLPLRKEGSMPLMVTGVSNTNELHESLRDHYGKKTSLALQPIVTAVHAGRIEDFEVDRVTKRATGLRTAICIFTSDEDMRGQLKIVRGLKAKNIRVIVLHLGYPRTLAPYREADALLLAYGARKYNRETIKAVTDILTGSAPVRILPPVRDLETQVGRAETYNAYDVIRAPAGRMPVSADGPFVAGFSIPYALGDTVKKVEWDFGDGSNAKGFTVERAYEAPGRYPITLTTIDQNNQRTTCTFYAAVGQ